MRHVNPLDPAVSLHIDFDGETIRGKAERFRCAAVRRRYDGTAYVSVIEAVHVDGVDAVAAWLRALIDSEKANAAEQEP